MRDKNLFCLALAIGMLGSQPVLAQPSGHADTTNMVSATGDEAKNITLDLKKVSVKELFDAIHQQTGMDFMYSTEQMAAMPRISVKAKDEPVRDVLERVFRNTDFIFTINGKMVTITKKGVVKPGTNARKISGTVTDGSKAPLIGANVKIKGSHTGVITNLDGQFTLEVKPGEILTFSFIGMESVDVIYKGQQRIDVTLKEGHGTQLNDVVVTGIFKKSKESYTGAATVITSDDLKRVGNRNLLTSIRNIDPSFNILDNSLMGSDPNSLPDITIRGNSSMTSNLKDLQSDSQTTQSANMPLFVMDGFEITLERMMDLDENQVESITLLKDASATAMYGTRGANGVVVITTKQPEPGKLRFTYKGSLSIEAPDLTSYDLLDAKEKLEYEKAAGLYEPSNGYQGSSLQSLQELYNSRLLAAERGVDTYWLKYPVRTGIGQEHSLRIEGGREEIRYSAGLSYKHIAGAMKGSDRNTLNGNVFLSYKVKNLTFQNDLIIAYNESFNSPYGSFSDYAKINAYWKPYDDEGNLLTVLDDRSYSSLPTASQSNTVYNPLHNAYLPGKDESNYKQIQNNFAVEWNILPELFVRGRFTVLSKNNRSDVYKPAGHTDFLSYTGEDYDRRGSYKMGIGETFKYEADLTLNYNKTFRDVHQLYVGLGYNFAEEKTESYSFLAEGIPDDYSDFMGLASQYEEDGQPYGDEGISRRVGAILNANYTYDRRYFIDVSGKMEGSSKFGADNRFAPFWSAGIGWNLHQEHFLIDNPTLNIARLRLSYGTSGTQNFSPYQAMRTFQYFSSENYNGLPGAHLLGIGNPDLGWQKTSQLNVGMEVEMFHNRMKLSVDFYNKLTNDMLADITLPLSSGFGSYKANVGKVLNRGVEMSLNAYVVRDTARELYWSIGGTLAYNKNEIQEISNSLEFLNEQLLENDGANPSFLFKEGQSMNTIFAVRSLGIDPANGKEIFLKTDGTRTYEWDAADKVACGVEDPKIWGNLNSMLRYKGLTFNAVFGYRYGGQMYNSTLANKVENIRPIDNADKRVLYDRWKEPGDHAKYKSVKDLSATNATSRFVADENTLECRSVSVGYEWMSEWLQKHLAISYLSLTAYGEDLFRISSIKQERGISYPFSRKFSLSLSIRF